MNDKSMNNAETLVSLFGGQAALADAVGVNRAVINRWCATSGKRAGYGIIPVEYYDRIRRAALERRDDMALGMEWLNAVQGCLPARACPTCGHPLEAGRVV